MNIRYNLREMRSEQKVNEVLVRDVLQTNHGEVKLTQGKKKRNKRKHTYLHSAQQTEMGKIHHTLSQETAEKRQQPVFWKVSVCM